MYVLTLFSFCFQIVKRRNGREHGLSRVSKSSAHTSPLLITAVMRTAMLVTNNTRPSIPPAELSLSLRPISGTIDGRPNFAMSPAPPTLQTSTITEVQPIAAFPALGRHHRGR